jgi:hypothetical protein
MNGRLIGSAGAWLEADGCLRARALAPTGRSALPCTPSSNGANPRITSDQTIYEIDSRLEELEREDAVWLRQGAGLQQAMP